MAWGDPTPTQSTTIVTPPAPQVAPPQRGQSTTGQDSQFTPWLRNMVMCHLQQDGTWLADSKAPQPGGKFCFLQLENKGQAIVTIDCIANRSHYAQEFKSLGQITHDVLCVPERSGLAHIQYGNKAVLDFSQAMLIGLASYREHTQDGRKNPNLNGRFICFHTFEDPSGRRFGMYFTAFLQWRNPLVYQRLNIRKANLNLAPPDESNPYLAASGGVHQTGPPGNAFPPGPTSPVPFPVDQAPPQQPAPSSDNPILPPTSGPLPY